MRLIGVIDLAGSLAVHARGGARAKYAPVSTVAGRLVSGDALALARTYVDHLGLTEIYAADLDAIVAAPPEGARVGPTDDHLPAHAAIAERLAAIAPLWLDAAVSSLHQARRALGLGAARVVVGLETLESFDALQAICRDVGGARVAFSLDLRHAVPVAPRLERFSHEMAPQLAARAADAGVGAVIVLDLARVGSGAGPDFDLMGRVRAAAPALTMLAGGGIRGIEDLTGLATVGCDGALVATALHDGRLSAADVRTLAHTSDSL